MAETKDKLKGMVGSYKKLLKGIALTKGITYKKSKTNPGVVKYRPKQTE